MSNENETVEQIAKKIERTVSIYGVKAFGPIAYSRGNLAERILAAHKREIAAKDKELLHLRGYLSVTGDCRKCEECGDETCPWYGEPDGCNNRNGREMFLAGELVDPLKAKDAEIASLKRTLKTAARWIMTHDIYGNMTKDILDDAKKLLNDDGRFLG